MARTRLPNALKRRHLVENDLDPRKALTIAEGYLEAGRTLEALAFLEKAGARQRLEQLRDDAVAGGDVFLVREVAAALGEEIDAACWRALAEGAAAAGKDQYALEARRQLAALED